MNHPLEQLPYQRFLITIFSMGFFRQLMDQEIGDAGCQKHDTGSKDIHWAQFIVIENNDLSGNPHQCRCQNNLDMNYIIPEVEDELLTTLFNPNPPERFVIENIENFN